jgi:hypothetical protein
MENIPQNEWMQHLRVASIPSTSLSLTARSTVFAASLTVSVADFLWMKEVENARGAKRVVRATRLARGVVLVRNDILNVFILLEMCWNFCC